MDELPSSEETANDNMALLEDIQAIKLAQRLCHVQGGKKSAKGYDKVGEEEIRAKTHHRHERQPERLSRTLSADAQNQTGCR